LSLSAVCHRLQPNKSSRIPHTSDLRYCTPHYIKRARTARFVRLGQQQASKVSPTWTQR
jgi:hypothetical protein